MRLPEALGVYLALIVGTSLANLQPRSYETRDYFALEIPPQTSPEGFAERLGLQYEGPVGELPSHYVFSTGKDNQRDLEQQLLASRNSTHRPETPLWAAKLGPSPPLEKRKPFQAEPTSRTQLLGHPDPAAVAYQAEVAARLEIHDPCFMEQWHLINTVQPGNDLNVTGAWLEGVSGEGVTVAVVDDGLDLDSQDLQPNYYATGSYDFNDHSPEPHPRLPDDHHGTLCAAEIAAAKNRVCGLGLAFQSRVSGIRLLSGPADDIDQAAAVNYDYQNNHIYSCSWGPKDDGQTMQAPGLLVQRALVHGVQHGRSGRGSLFVFAAGNGASSDDNCNFDGYANSIYSITVGAIDRLGTHPPYAESCAAQLVVTYSSGHGHGIYSTDNGDQCFSLHSGTSAASPLAAGAIALALSVRPELTWRDVQYLLVETAVPVHTSDGSWQPTAGGRMFSHDWGYGKLDVSALVQKARNWALVPPQAWLHSPWQEVHRGIHEGSQGLPSDYAVSLAMLQVANLAHVEHVTITINVNHTRRGDLSVTLISPDDVISALSTPRMPDDHRSGYRDWTFMSVAHWGESGIGTWRVIVKDTNVNGQTGTFINWRLTLWGAARDDSRHASLKLPGQPTDYGTELAAIPTTIEASPTSAIPNGTVREAVGEAVGEDPNLPRYLSSALHAIFPPPIAAPMSNVSLGLPSSPACRVFSPRPHPRQGGHEPGLDWPCAALGAADARHCKHARPSDTHPPGSRLGSPPGTAGPGPPPSRFPHDAHWTTSSAARCSAESAGSAHLTRDGLLGKACRLCRNS
ncbi:peptidase S8/S53 domain-containing protein [Aspergillus desertorum]